MKPHADVTSVITSVQGGILVTDESTEEAQTDWTIGSLVQPFKDDSGFMIHTGIVWGRLRVRQVVWTERPTLDDLDAWEDVVIVLVNDPTGTLLAHSLQGAMVPLQLPYISLSDTPEWELRDGVPGVLRWVARIAARGRDTQPGQEVFPGPAEHEEYRFDFWPADTDPDEVSHEIKTTSTESEVFRKPKV